MHTCYHNLHKKEGGGRLISKYLKVVTETKNYITMQNEAINIRAKQSSLRIKASRLFFFLLNLLTGFKFIKNSKYMLTEH